MGWRQNLAAGFEKRRREHDLNNSVSRSCRMNPAQGSGFDQGHDLKMSVSRNMFLTPPQGSVFDQGHDLKISVSRNIFLPPPQASVLDQGRVSTKYGHLGQTFVQPLWHFQMVGPGESAARHVKKHCWRNMCFCRARICRTTTPTLAKPKH